MTAQELRHEADRILDRAVEAGYATRDGRRYEGQGREFCEAWNRAATLRKQARKLELATRPTCEVDGCTRPITWNVAGSGMCGRHKTQTMKAYHRQFDKFGVLAMAANLTKRDILDLATGSITPAHDAEKGTT